MASFVLSRGLNVAVLHMASRLFPTGFDIGADAPDSLETLRAHVEKTGRMLVWSGAADSSIYGCAEVNYAFRAWHDSAHLRGGFDFSPEGEARAAEMQADDLRKVYGSGPEVESWIRILRAEITGQAEYVARNGRFPDDQGAFIAAYLDCPDSALSMAF